MLCVVVYRNVKDPGHLHSYLAEARSAKGELCTVGGNGSDIYIAAGDYLGNLAKFVERGGELYKVSETDMRRTSIPDVPRIRDEPFISVQFRYPKETLEKLEYIHFYEGLEK